LHRASVTLSLNEFFAKSGLQDSQYAYVSAAGNGERKGGKLLAAAVQA